MDIPLARGLIKATQAEKSGAQSYRSNECKLYDSGTAGIFVSVDKGNPDQKVQGAKSPA